MREWGGGDGWSMDGKYVISSVSNFIQYVIQFHKYINFIFMTCYEDEYVIVVLFLCDRRGHDVLRKSLPPKNEYVIQVKMSPIQRRLYKAFMDLTNDEEVNSWANNNILKAFSVCCKVREQILVHNVLLLSKVIIYWVITVYV